MHSLCDNDAIFTDDFDKANLLNNVYRSETVLNDDNVQTPVLSPVHEFTLSSITLSPLDVKQTLEILPLDKGVGPVMARCFVCSLFSAFSYHRWLKVM